MTDLEPTAGQEDSAQDVAATAEAATPPLSTPSTPSATHTPLLADDDATPKKVTAKELVQLVKLQKKKLVAKEQELAELKERAKQDRAKAVMSCVAAIEGARRRRVMVGMLASWRREAERARAAEEMERLAQMCAASTAHLDELREQTAAAQREKAEMDAHNKKLKALLAKARQQMTEQKQSKEQAPDNFMPEDVVRRTRGPDGVTYLLIARRARGGGAGGEPGPFEWRDEAQVRTWFPDEDAFRRAEARFAPLVEEELVERHARAMREVEARLAVAQQDTEAVNERFAQYMRRAELALSMAEQHRESDKTGEAISAELAKLSRERDVLVVKMEEQKMKLDSCEAAMSALKVSNHQVKEERDELGRKIVRAEADLLAAHEAHRHALLASERVAEERLAAEHAARRAVEVQLSDALRQNAKVQAEDAAHVQAAKEAGARLESVLEENERVRASLQAFRDAPARVAPQQPTAMAGVLLAKSDAARRSSDLQQPAAAAAHHHQQQQHQQQQQQQQQQHSALVSPAFSPSSQPSTPRQSSFVGDEAGGGDFSPDMGSRFFVDQIQALRAARRNERAEWQHEMHAQSAKLAEASRAKDELGARVARLEQDLAQTKLAEERRNLLGSQEGLTYLKNAVLRFMTADEDSERETLLPVIATLLKFSKEEAAMLSQPVEARGSRGVFGLF